MVYGSQIIASASLSFLIAIAINFYHVAEELKHATARLNSTAENCDPELLIFNRVPKVGSQTILNIIGILTERNGYDALTSIEGMPEHFVGETTWIPDRASRELTVKAILREKEGRRRPLAFIKHQGGDSMEISDKTLSQNFEQFVSC